MSLYVPEVGTVSTSSAGGRFWSNYTQQKDNRLKKNFRTEALTRRTAHLKIGGTRAMITPLKRGAARQAQDAENGLMVRRPGGIIGGLAK